MIKKIEKIVFSQEIEISGAKHIHGVKGRSLIPKCFHYTAFHFSILGTPSLADS